MQQKQASRPVEDLLAHPRLPNKTVFVLGSGFSKPLGVPVMADFVPEGLALLKAAAWHGKGDAKQVGADQDLLNRMLNLLRDYEATLAQLEVKPVNLENLFCLVDLLGRREKNKNVDRKTLQEFIARTCALAWRHHEDEWQKAKQKADPCSALLEATTVEFRHYFPDEEAHCPRSKSDKCGGCAYDTPSDKPCRWPGPTCDAASNVCLYEAFLSQVMYRGWPKLKPARCPQEYVANAIITLNYDLIIERIAKKLGVRVFYGQGVLADNVKLNSETAETIALTSDRCAIQRCLPLVKLHGSLNWKNPSKHGCAVSRCDLSETHQWNAPLILPTWQRDPIERGPSAQLLTAARLHLRLASRLVFIGYSMPPTDVYLRYLFADALATPELPEIEVCNRHWTLEEAKEHCQRLLGPRAAARVAAVYNGLEAYVRAHKKPFSL